MFWDKDFSVWQNIVINFTLKRAIKEVLEGKIKSWEQVMRELEKK
ncbi:unnamed protein product [marine sediment metagenome]|uniref:Uncharacterized protein n=1 Tax=marine sediment metagenome TaxID=412755 RepID=X1ILE3_9ZZZZ